MKVLTMRVLMVLTSHHRLGNTGKKTGFWLEEFSAPYYVMLDAGATITLASPMGGHPPIDPASEEPGSQPDSMFRFEADPRAREALAHTLKLSSVSAEDFDAAFYPGGHGPLWDLAKNRYSLDLIKAMQASGKPVVAVCHAPGILCHAKAPDGKPLVSGKRVTGFSNSEEAAVGLTEVVPFLVEDALKAEGAIYSKGANWTCYVQVDDTLITGQNPASSRDAAEALVHILQMQAEAAGEVE